MLSGWEESIYGCQGSSLRTRQTPGSVLVSFSGMGEGWTLYAFPACLLLPHTTRGSITEQKKINLKQPPQSWSACPKWEPLSSVSLSERARSATTVLSLYVTTQHRVYKPVLNHSVFPTGEGKKSPIQLTNSIPSGAWNCNQFLRGRRRRQEWQQQCNSKRKEVLVLFWCR